MDWEECSLVNTENYEFEITGEVELHQMISKTIDNTNSENQFIVNEIITRDGDESNIFMTLGGKGGMYCLKVDENMKDLSGIIRMKSRVRRDGNMVFLDNNNICAFINSGSITVGDFSFEDSKMNGEDDGSEEDFISNIKRMAGHSDTVYCLEKLDESHFCSGAGSSCKRIIVWNHIARTRVHTLLDHEEWVLSLHQIPQLPDVLVSGGGNPHIRGDYSLRLWDWKKGKLIRRYPKLHKREVIFLSSYLSTRHHLQQQNNSSSSSCHLHYMNLKIISGSMDSHVRVWNVHNSDCVKDVFTGNVDADISCFLSLSRYLLVAKKTDDEKLSLFDLEGLDNNNNNEEEEEEEEEEEPEGNGDNIASLKKVGELCVFTDPFLETITTMKIISGRKKSYLYSCNDDEEEETQSFSHSKTVFIALGTREGKVKIVRLDGVERKEGFGTVDPDEKERVEYISEKCGVVNEEEEDVFSGCQKIEISIDCGSFVEKLVILKSLFLS